MDAVTTVFRTCRAFQNVRSGWEVDGWARWVRFYGPPAIIWERGGGKRRGQREEVRGQKEKRARRVQPVFSSLFSPLYPLASGFSASRFVKVTWPSFSA